MPSPPNTFTFKVALFPLHPSTIHTTQYNRVTILNAGNVKESLFNKMKFEITGVLSHSDEIKKKYKTPFYCTS